MISLAMVAASIALVAPGEFRAQLEAVAGQSVRLDPRIAIPACPGGHRFAARPTAVDAACPELGWRLVVPVAGAGPTTGDGAERLVRRGSAVVVEASGSGYAVRVDGIAESDATAGGVVRVRNARSGQRMLATVQGDGRLVVDGR